MLYSVVCTEGEEDNDGLYETHSTSTAHNANSKVSSFFRPYNSISINGISASATQETERPEEGRTLECI